MRWSIPKHEVNIALVGKYVDLTESYKSLIEALIHAGIHTRSKVKIHYIDSEEIEAHGAAALAKMDAILVPGGFGKRGTEGKIAAIRYARENKIPYLGICLGMQLAVIEYARHVAGMTDANSTEFNPDTPHPVVALITEWRTAKAVSRNAMPIPTSAAPCAWARSAARSRKAPWRVDLRQGSERAPSPSL